MNPRAIALAVLVGLGLLAAGIAWALDDPDDGRRPSAQAPSGRPSDPPLKRCSPPGPAAIDPRTGETLCGKEALKYIREQQKRAQPPPPDPAILRRGRRIVAKDPTLRRLLRGQRYKIAQIGGWSAGDGSNELLGVGGNIDLKDPITVDGVLPYVCAGDPRKGTGKFRLSVSNVTQLHFLAQFSTDSVVEISPLASPGRSSPSGSRPTVLPGSTRCPPSEGD